jgi:hypothetical protein
MLDKGTFDLAVVLAGEVACLLVLAGLFVRRRHRVCYVFPVYLLVVVAADFLMLLGPRHLEPPHPLYGILGQGGFYSRPFWLMKEVLINLLRFALALELAYRTFRAFPGARSTARGVVLVLTTVTLVSLLAITPEVSTLDRGDQITQIIGRLQPRVLNGSVWLFTGMAAVIVWYRLPVDQFHKAILTGLVPYLLIFTIGLNLMDSYGWDRSVMELANYLSAFAYLALLTFWARAAWLPVAAPVQAKESLAVLERQSG